MTKKASQAAGARRLLPCYTHNSASAFQRRSFEVVRHAGLL